MGHHGRESRTHADKSSRHKREPSRRESQKTSHHHHHRRSSSRDRHHHHQHHHSSHHHHHHSRREHASGTKHKEHTHQAHTERFPSSSVGPGVIEPVLFVILILLALAALSLLGVSIWLYATRNGWPSGLNQTGSVAWTRFISYATACLLVSILLVIIIALSIPAALTQIGSTARYLRLSLVFVASLTAFILLLMFITALLFATSPPFITRAVDQSWRNTVQGDNFFVACRVQNRFNCIGWEDNSCKNCRPTVGGNYNGCSGDQGLVCPRCYQDTRRVLSQNKLSAVGIIGSDVPVAAGEVQVYNKKRQSRKLSHATTVAKTSEIASALKVNTLKVQVTSRKGARLGNFKGENKSGFRANIRPQFHTLSRQDSGNEDYELGCRRFIEWRMREFFIPMAVFTVFLLIVMLLISWKACIDSSGR